MNENSLLRALMGQDDSALAPSEYVTNRRQEPYATRYDIQDTPEGVTINGKLLNPSSLGSSSARYEPKTGMIITTDSDGNQSVVDPETASKMQSISIRHEQKLPMYEKQQADTMAKAKAKALAEGKNVEIAKDYKVDNAPEDVMGALKPQVETPAPEQQAEEMIKEVVKNVPQEDGINPFWMVALGSAIGDMVSSGRGIANSPAYIGDFGMKNLQKELDHNLKMQSKLFKDKSKGLGPLYKLKDGTYATGEQAIGQQAYESPKNKPIKTIKDERGLAVYSDEPVGKEAWVKGASPKDVEKDELQKASMRSNIEKGILGTMNQSPSVRLYKESLSDVKNIAQYKKDIAKNPRATSGIRDEILLTTAVRVFDPRGVVRPQEQEMLKETGGIWNTISSKIAQYMKENGVDRETAATAVMDNNTRKQLINAVLKMSKVRTEGAQAELNTAREKAKKYGIDLSEPDFENVSAWAGIEEDPSLEVIKTNQGDKVKAFTNKGTPILIPADKAKDPAYIKKYQLKL